MHVRARAQIHAPAGAAQRVAYQGVPGAYSESAARKACPGAEPLPCEQFEVAFQALTQWLADTAVLPIENSVGGSIHTVFDLLIKQVAAPAACMTLPTSIATEVHASTHIGEVLLLKCMQASFSASGPCVVPVQPTYVPGRATCMAPWQGVSEQAVLTLCMHVGAGIDCTSWARCRWMCGTASWRSPAWPSTSCAACRATHRHGPSLFSTPLQLTGSLRFPAGGVCKDRVANYWPVMC